MNFFRKYDCIFKGWSVPDWAHSHKREGMELDFYARAIWDKAIWEARYEQTPMPTKNERIGPNIIQWFRFEDYMSGYGSRLFYNEVPNPTWYRYKGTFEQEDRDKLFSFKDADQEFDPKNILGADPSTPDGKKKIEEQFDMWNRAMPWLYKNELEVYEVGPTENISKEAHHQRIWHHYRAYYFKQILNKLI